MRTLLFQVHFATVIPQIKAPTEILSMVKIKLIPYKETNVTVSFYLIALRAMRFLSWMRVNWEEIFRTFQICIVNIGSLRHEKH